MMSTMVGRTVCNVAFTRTVGMGSREQVEGLALETSLATWTASTGVKAERWQYEERAVGAAALGVRAVCGAGGAGALSCKWMEFTLAWKKSRKSEQRSRAPGGCGAAMGRSKLFMVENSWPWVMVE